MKTISDQYEHLLSIPSSKRTPQIILCPVGLIGAGKTTVTKILSEKLSLLRIRRDDIRELLKEHGYTYGEVDALTKQLVIKYIHEGYSIALDGDCAGPQLKAFTKEVKGIKLIWIHINPPEEFILKHIDKIEPSLLFKDSTMKRAAYFERKPLHEHLDMPFVYTFDTSKPNMDEQIEEAVQIISKI